MEPTTEAEALFNLAPTLFDDGKSVMEAARQAGAKGIMPALTETGRGAVWEFPDGSRLIIGNDEGSVTLP